ncbi:sensor histidine kinase [Trujillonella humicola]|uniref:sensor histidine kinase n=1 Tax=Trujillonella humicola TaxID=3383699 RepID=UPI003906C5D9
MAADLHDPPHRPGWLRGIPPGRHFTVFVVWALVVLIAVATGAVLISGRIARSNALAEAERIAVRLGEFVIAPLARDALAGDPDAYEDLDRDLQNRLTDGSLVSVVVWRADGSVYFATIDELIGRQFGVSDDLREALAGEVVAHVDEEPETAYGDVDGPLLEIYVPVDAGAEPLVVEAYFATDSIDRQASLLRGEIIPLAVGSLVVLQLIQLPIAASMVRRARRAETQRVASMARSLAASERERRAIAGDVHDGPVQDLAGVSYALSALRSSVPEERRATVDRLTATVRHAVASLRRLMVDIYPPDLSGPGLATALDDLAQRLRESGTEVTVSVDPVPELPPEYVAVLYRTAKEALANVARHAGAGRAWVTLTRTGTGEGQTVLLTVADDGVGVDAEAAEAASRNGHLGLRLLRERLLAVDGDLGVEPGADGGTVLTAVLPVPASGAPEGRPSRSRGASSPSARPDPGSPAGSGSGSPEAGGTPP